LTPGAALDDDVLIAMAFGSRSPVPDDPRCVRIALEPLSAPDLAEVWRGRGPVRTGQSGLIRYAESEHHWAGCISIDEGAAGDLSAVTETAYRALLRYHAVSPYRHVCRIWNYLADINAGADDDERYRQFCLGRARAFSAEAPGRRMSDYPAASAVGKKSARRSLDVCWIASRSPVTAVENPRQVSAYRYPRQYGPASPSFSRCAVTAEGLLLISGTASIVGHESLHSGDLDAQIGETLRNIDALLEAAAAQALIDQTTLEAGSLVRVYLRNESDIASVIEHLGRRFGTSVPVLVLGADICRSELLIEIEVAHQGRLDSADGRA